MTDYVVSDSGKKVPLNKVEAEGGKKIICPYCQREFIAADIKFRAEKDYDPASLTEAEAKKMQAQATGDEEEKIRAERRYEDCRKFMRKKHSRFTDGWRDRRWLDSKMCEHTSGYYFEDPGKEDGTSGLSDPEAILIDNVEFCVLNKETMNGFVYDDDGYIIGAREVHPGGETRVSTKKMCPHCYCLLPSDFGKYPSNVLAVLGVRGSGKTLYIAQLLDDISNKFAEMGLVVNASNDAIKNFTARYRARQNASYVGTEPKAYPPMFLNVQKRGTSDWERNIILYDIAGENCVDGQMNRFGSFIWRADGIVLLVSPEQIDRHSHKGEIEFDPKDLITYPKNQEPPALDAVIKTIFNVASRRIVRRLKRKVPLALTLSKSDVYIRAKKPGNQNQMIAVANKNSALSKNVGYSDCSFMTEQHINLMGEVKAILKSGSLEAVLSKFKLKNYFAFSSLGRPLSDIAENGESAEPVRIEEPIAWIMAEWGWLKFEGQPVKSFIAAISDKFRR